MKQNELKEIKEVLNKIHKTLLYVFMIIAFFALLEKSESSSMLFMVLGLTIKILNKRIK